ncbi:MAG TPA: LuxR C-terminal-related transcriptional regulator [Nitrospira sp.]|nr:LuxR C-terminal-related transcriptional regulator [Nitrospira sp.]
MLKRSAVDELEQAVRVVWAGKTYMAEGRTVTDIAILLKVSTQRVEMHKAHAMDQLGLRTTVELIKCVIRTHRFT